MGLGGRIDLLGDEPEGPYYEIPGPSTEYRHRHGRRHLGRRFIDLDPVPYYESPDFVGWQRSTTDAPEYSRFIDLDPVPPLESNVRPLLGRNRRGRGYYR